MNAKKICTRCGNEYNISMFMSFSTRKETSECENCRRKRKKSKECKQQRDEAKECKMEQIIESDTESEITTPMSEEQQSIIDLVLERKNVQVIAKAGTGKTTMAI